MSYEPDGKALAAEIIYIESARHSNANLLRIVNGRKRYSGIAKALFACLRGVFKRYNISPAKATRLEYDFVTRVAESEFYLQQANA